MNEIHKERESLVYLIRAYQKEREIQEIIGTTRVAFYSVLSSSASLWWEGDRGESYKLSVHIHDTKIETKHASLENAVDAFLGALKA